MTVTPLRRRTAMSDKRTRWSRLTPGSKVLLRYGSASEDYVETALFIEYFPGGSDAHAASRSEPEEVRFRSLDGNTDDLSPETVEALLRGPATTEEGERVWYEWESYRYQGRWVVGSGAERLTILAHETDACPEGDEFGGLCAYPVGHKGAHAFSGGDAEGREAHLRAQALRHAQERVCDWYGDQAVRDLLTRLQALDPDSLTGASVTLTVRVGGETIYDWTRNGL